MHITSCQGRKDHGGMMAFLGRSKNTFLMIRCGTFAVFAGGAAPPGPPALPKIFKIWKQNKNPAKSCVRSLYMYHQH